MGTFAPTPPLVFGVLTLDN